MRRISLVLSVLGVAACASVGGEASPPALGDGAVLHAAELARVRCVLLAPFENASDTAGAADAATTALVAGVDPARARVFPVSELRALFRDTPLELPQGIAPSLAVELAELVGADAALYGAVEGRTRDDDGLLVTVRLSLAGEHQLLFARTFSVRPGPGEKPDAAIRRAVIDVAGPMLARLGDPTRKRCFDPERTKALRRFASTDTKAPAKAPVAAAIPVVKAGATTLQPRTPRQADWAKRITGGERVVVEDVVFTARTAALQRDGGLADLAIALSAAPETKVRLEAFVDATSDRSADAKLSTAMAKAAGERLVQLGVDRERLSWTGRGGESPLLPNFTVRGRAANRRLEVVARR
jgi:outer membrane protein OmpA-like peptidoglycan-associated protein